MYPTLLHIDEGGGAKGYTVVLDTQPTAEVTVRAISNSTVTTGFDRNLTFTTGNWNIPQRVSIATPQDDDTDGQHLGMIHSATGGGYGSVDVDRVDIRFTDPDVRGEISLGEVQPVEEDAGTVRVEVVAVTVQEGAPRTDYAMRVTSSRITAREGSDYEGVNERVDFPNGDFTAFVNDDGETRYRQTATFDFNILNDGIAEDTETFALFLGSAGGDYAGERAGVGIIVVTINDNDPLGVTVDPGTLEIDEGNSDTYDVVLDTQPAGPVTVTIKGITDADLSLDKATLTFTGLDWNVPQTVTVTAEQDDDQVNEPAVILTHTLSSLEVDFDDLSAADVTVSVTDDDLPVEMQMEYSLVEAGPFEEDVGTVQVEVVAVTNEAGVPSIDYAVRVQSENVTANSPGDYEAVDETLDFPLGDFAAFVNDVGDTRYRQTVSFDVVIVDNRFDEGTETFRLKLSESPGYEGSVFGVPEIEVTINDNDTAGVTVDPTALTIEEGATKTYTVVLDSTPTWRNATVTINDPANPEITAEPDSLTFTENNWNEPQNVTVTAGQDSDATDEVATEITHTVTSAFAQYNGLTADSVTVTVTDDDTAGVSISKASLEIEEGDSDSYEVKLDTEPAGDVVVAISGHAGTDLTLSGDTLSADYKLTFTFDDWSAAQRVTVKAEEDDDATGDAETLSHAVSVGSAAEYIGVAISDVAVTITDNDAVVTIAADAVSVTEGAPAAFTLTRAGNTDTALTVVVSVTEEGEYISGAAPTSASFEANDVTTSLIVATVDDGADEANGSVTAALQAGAGYVVGTDDAATVTITDDDAAGVTIDPTTLTVTEGDVAGESYTVRLDSQPSGDVVVAISGHAGTDLTLSGETLSADYKLTFTVDDWSEAQRVTVKAAEDSDATGDADVVLEHDISSAADAVYAGLADRNVTVSITEKDAAGVAIDPTTLTVTEGDAVGESYTVRLDSQPSGDVVVAISGHAGTDLTLSGDTLSADYKLTFTFDDWSAAQRVTVKAEEDDDATGDAETLSHAVSVGSAAEYIGVAISDVAVTITDNDAVVTIAADAVSVTEGAPAAFTLTRAGNTDTALTVVVSVTEEGEYISGAAPTSASFEANDVTTSLIVATVDDGADEANGSVTAALQAGAWLRGGYR